MGEHCLCCTLARVESSEIDWLNASPPTFIADLCCSVLLMLAEGLDLFNDAAKHEAFLGQGRKFIPSA